MKSANATYRPTALFGEGKGIRDFVGRMEVGASGRSVKLPGLNAFSQDGWLVAFHHEAKLVRHGGAANAEDLIQCVRQT